MAAALDWLRRRYREAPPGIAPRHQRFYFAAAWGYPCGLLWHFTFIFVFWLVGAPPLSALNVLATAIWIAALWLHLHGWLRTAVLLVGGEIVVHAVACAVLIGWQTGFQFYLVAMAAVLFFAPLGHVAANIALALGNAFTFVGLHYVYADAMPRIALPSWIIDALFYGNALSAFFVISLAAASYDRAATEAEAALGAEKAKSDELAGLLRRMFGRYLSPEVMEALIEKPESLELGGEKRRVTIMMTDLRGFTAMAERLAPEQVVRMLNGYFEVMVEIITRYHGTINEIIGDALLVFFGAPQPMPDRAEQAIACAIEMQNAMARVNDRNRAEGLPELQMGIGLNDAEVVVGNIGTARRSKYAAVGSGVNMTSRIESYTVGGQILVSESVREAAGHVLRVDGQRDVRPKGSEMPLRIYEVGGIGGRFNLALADRTPAFVALARRLPLRYSILEDKETGGAGGEAAAVRVAKSALEIELDRPLTPMTNLKLNLAAAGEALGARDFYAKVVVADGGAVRVSLTAVPPEIDAFLEALRRYAMPS